jgi:hypothetical protein
MLLIHMQADGVRGGHPMIRIDDPFAPTLNCTAIRYSDGRYEIRENDNADGWIRTVSPVWIET